MSIKEVKFRPKIGKGDFDTKVRHMQDFLDEGHKVKVTLQFRGREMAHPELGSKILDDVIAQSGRGAKVETQARLEGRNMTMVLAPDKKARRRRTAAGQERQPHRRANARSTGTTRQPESSERGNRTPETADTGGTATQRRAPHPETSRHRATGNARRPPCPR